MHKCREDRTCTTMSIRHFSSSTSLALVKRKKLLSNFWASDHWMLYPLCLNSPWQRSSPHPLVSVQPGTSLQGGGWWHWKLLWCGWAASMSKWQRRSLVWRCPLETVSGGGWLQVELLTWSTCKPKRRLHFKTSCGPLPWMRPNANETVTVYVPVWCKWGLNFLLKLAQNRTPKIMTVFKHSDINLSNR